LVHKEFQDIEALQVCGTRLKVLVLLAADHDSAPSPLYPVKILNPVDIASTELNETELNWLGSVPLSSVAAMSTNGPLIVVKL